MTDAARIVIPYEPRPWQRLMHDQLEKHRFAAICCHRRAGKTVGMVNDGLRDVLTCVRERPQAAYIMPTYRQAKQVAWDYMKHFSEPIPGRTVNESELRIDFPNGGRMLCLGVENPDALRGLYLDWACLDEPREMQGRAWSEVILPALADRQGRARLVGTSGGRGFWYETFEHAKADPEWYCETFDYRVTDALPADEIERQRRNQTPEQFAQEYECSWSAGLRGAFYAKLMEEADREGRIGAVGYDPALPVHTWWDLGMRDSMSVGFVQVLGREVRAIDYLELEGAGLPDVIRELQKRPYVYGTHTAPHDISVRDLSESGGKSRWEVCAALGVRFRMAPNLSLSDGISAVRLLLPRMHFDRVKCKGWIEALESYRSEVNPKTDELMATPLHNWASHAADMTRYGALGLREVRETSRPQPRVDWVT